MSLLEWYNGVSDKIVGAEVKFLLKPIGEGFTDVVHALTNVMPEIGAGIVVVCAVGMMLTGNIPKWLGRLAVGLGGVIIWIIST